VKRRIIVAIIIYLNLLALAIVLTILAPASKRGLFIVLGISAIILNTIYLICGLTYFINYFIYFAAVGILIWLFPSFTILFALFGGTLVVVNPLAFLTKILDKAWPHTSKGILKVNNFFFIKRRAYFRYRSAMKEHYHLPQFLKIKNHRTYKLLHSASLLFILFLVVFLLFWDIPRIAFANLTQMSIFRMYVGVALFILDFILYKKGFSSLLAGFTILVFPAFIILAVILYKNLGPTLFIIFISITFVTMSLNLFYQLKSYYSRVSYLPIHYVDAKTGVEVHANGFFETFVYSNSYTFMAKYTIKASKTKFNQKFQKLLEYLNFRKIILMSYTSEGDEISLYFLFYKKDQKKNQALKVYLMSLLEQQVSEYSFDDRTFSIFEGFFMQRTEFIIAYAKNLAYLSRLLLETKLILISITYYFTKYEKMMSFFHAQKSVRVKNIESYQTFVLNTNIECVNNDFIIENSMLDTIILASINEGKFIKLNIYNIKEN
jgi:hypothetical protein